MEHICCGCSACALVCPTNAIKMKVNEDGFYTADIDKEKCIHCGLCDKICIYNNDKTELGEKLQIKDCIQHIQRMRKVENNVHLEE